jgi:hypothetical protein
MADAAFPVEILAPGTFKGIAVTDAMLDEMVANFGRLHAAGIKPPVRLGHGWDDTKPAAGWVRGLKRMGEKLIAELADVPDVVRRAIKAKRYNRCSAEFWTRFEHSEDEKNLKSGVRGAALTGLALLGGIPPVVKSLADLETWLAEGVQPEDGALALSTDDPTLLDEAQARGGDAGAVSPVASSTPLDVPALAAALLAELRTASHADRHPRTTSVSTSVTKEPMMDDATKQALLSELRAELATDFETKLADERTKHTDELKAVRAEVTALSEAKAQTEAELKRIADEKREAEGRARHVEAVKFAEDQLRAPRLFKPQVPFATALYEMLSDAPTIKAEAAEAMGLPKRDWSLRGIFAELVGQYPTANLLRELSTAPAPVHGDPSDELGRIAMEHKLDLSEPAGVQQALALLKTKGVAIPDYRTPTRTH